jgi:large subunit ribosomal protein L10e
VYLISNNAVQIRDNSLEAARVVVTQSLEKAFGKPQGYFFRLRPYPHHVIRENPMATGAGADRFQQGMRQSFGNPIGNAAQVRVGQILMEVLTDEANIKRAKTALNCARYKLPTTCRIVVQDAK